MDTRYDLTYFGLLVELLVLKWSVQPRVTAIDVARSVVCLSVCVSVCMLVTRMYCAQMAELTEMPFGRRLIWAQGSRKNHVVDGG